MKARMGATHFLSAPPFHLRSREVLVPVVHGLELAAINGDARRCEKTHLAAEFDEARTYLSHKNSPAESRENHNSGTAVFTQPGSFASFGRPFLADTVEKLDLR
jgi:hypothetical protein